MIPFADSLFFFFNFVYLIAKCSILILVVYGKVSCVIVVCCYELKRAQKYENSSNVVAQ